MKTLLTLLTVTSALSLGFMGGAYSADGVPSAEELKKMPNLSLLVRALVDTNMIPSSVSGARPGTQTPLSSAGILTTTGGSLTPPPGLSGFALKKWISQHPEFSSGGSGGLTSSGLSQSTVVPPVKQTLSTPPSQPTVVAPVQPEQSTGGATLSPPPGLTGFALKKWMSQHQGASSGGSGGLTSSGLSQASIVSPPVKQTLSTPPSLSTVVPPAQPPQSTGGATPTPPPGLTGFALKKWMAQNTGGASSEVRSSALTSLELSQSTVVPPVQQTLSTPPLPSTVVPPAQPPQSTGGATPTPPPGLTGFALKKWMAQHQQK